MSKQSKQATKETSTLKNEDLYRQVAELRKKQAAQIHKDSGRPQKSPFSRASREAQLATA